MIHLADAAGCRRIKIAGATAADSFNVNALCRWVDATVEASYDPANPTATPTDYRVLTFILDRAEPALRAYVKDALRVYAGISPLNNGDALFAVAVQRETYDNNRERRVNPQAPMFSEVGNWH